MDFVSNDAVRSHTGQPLLSDAIRQRRLSSFGHLCHADIGQDHSRAFRACIRGPPKNWRRRTGRPKQTWLRTTLAWRWQDGTLWIDRHGVYSWMRERKRERERDWARLPLGLYCVGYLCVLHLLMVCRQKQYTVADIKA